MFTHPVALGIAVLCGLFALIPKTADWSEGRARFLLVLIAAIAAAVAVW
ncbi:MAG: hypothetical protein ACLQME_02735 [Alphaproteobacteria bacterium]